MSLSQNQPLKQLDLFGEVTLVEPNTIRLRLNDNAELRLKTQFDAVLYYIQHMDTSMLNLTLSNDYKYQHRDKKGYLEKLDLVFDKFKSEGSTLLNIFDGKCNNCYRTNQKIKGFTFKGNNNCKYHMNLLFQVENNQVFDICACADFGNDINKKESSSYISVTDFYYSEYKPDSYADDNNIPF